MSYDVTYDEYMERIKLKNEIVEILKDAKTKLLYSQAKSRSGSDLDRSSLPLIGSPAEILDTITKIESVLSKIELDTSDNFMA
jgi:hypothetical protein